MTKLTTWLETAHRHQENRDFPKAEQFYRQVLRADPYNADAEYLLGTTCQAQNKTSDALTHLTQALRIRSGFAEARQARALLFASKGDFGEAIEELHQAIALKPNYAEAHHNLGVTLARTKRLDEAISSFRQAIHLNPDNPEAILNLALTCEENENLDDATMTYQQLLRWKPNDAAIHSKMGFVFVKRRLLPQAVEEFQQAIIHNPGNPSFHNNLGAAFAELGRPADALAQFNAALEIKPDHVDSRMNRGMSLLHLGDFENGWKEYEWRWQGKDFANLPYREPAWDGSSLQGRRILLYPEQGFGDTLQFIRYAALVKERGGTVVFESPPELARILRSCAGIDEVVLPGSERPNADVHAPLLSLPRILKTTIATIPATIPYLHADATLTQKWQKELSRFSDFKVGIIWQGNPRFSRPQCRAADQRRSIPLLHFEPLARIPGVKLFSLQKGYGTEQLADVKSRWGVVELGDKLQDFMDTAAVMMNMDLIISADTSPAHLAGALGRPVWAVLPFAGCWRWLLDREDSPWYPTMTLFRQKNRGDWEEVLQRIAKKLERDHEDRRHHARLPN